MEANTNTKPTTTARCEHPRSTMDTWPRPLPPSPLQPARSTEEEERGVREKRATYKVGGRREKGRANGRSSATKKLLEYTPSYKLKFQRELNV
jgi:hypothetical protein